MVAFRPTFAVLAASVLAAISSLSTQVSAWTPISVSRTLDIDGQPFYLPIEPLTSFSGLVSSEILPFTAIVSSSGEITSDTIKDADTAPVRAHLRERLSRPRPLWIPIPYAERTRTGRRGRLHPEEASRFTGLACIASG